jgi:M6 family metalloprotease-like protein
MKKILPALLSIFLTVSALGACDFLNKTGNSNDSASSINSSEWAEETSSSDGAESVLDSKEEESSKEESVSHEESSKEESVSREESSKEESSNEEESSKADSSDIESKYTYNAFTAQEKALFNEYFGFVIPFVENDEYYVEEYTMYYEDTDETEVGLNFYTFGNTKSEFNAYKALFTTAGGYTYDDTENDEYGDAWYYYSKDGYYIDMSYYNDGLDDIIDVYVYELVEGNVGGDAGGSEDGGEDSGDTDVNVELLANNGKGLPSDVGGVYDVDFTKAKYAKNVTEQGSYLGGCPTVGKPAVLVIPVEFNDVTAASKGYTIDKIKKAFNGGAGATDYFSVHDYYYQSSFGALDLQITVLDSWFKPKYNSSYYAEATIEYYGSQVAAGDQMIMDEALAALDGSMDLSKFDSDGNAIIDAVVLVNTLEIDEEVTFQWAYRYWNIYTDDEGHCYEYDGVSANDYLWASYQFMLETYDEDGNTIYDDSALETYTYIHEFGHVLGADDYYDTSYTSEDTPLSGCDIMDSMNGDHNAYTKFHYGWLTSSRLVAAEDSVTLVLEDFSKNGDTIIIANDWDAGLGAYQEYYIVVYYTNNGLNAGDFGYFSRDGIVVYHVNASLYKDEYEGETYYDVYYNNTDPSDESGYGTTENLIEFVKSPEDTFTYVAGDSLSAKVKTDSGEKIAYTFTVDSLTADSATITFNKNN